jgi:signal transduction histidine kinase
MDDFQRLQRTTYGYLMVQHGILITFALAFFFVGHHLGFPVIAVAIADGVATTILAHVVAIIASRIVMQPFHKLWQAILYVTSESTIVDPPNMGELRYGRELVTSLANRVYQFADQQDGAELAKHRQSVVQAVNIVGHFPLPLFVFNKQLVVTSASNSALEYLAVESAQLFGQQLFESIDLEFPDEHTMQAWIEDCQENKVTAQGYWQRVRVRLKDGKTVKQCDVAAYYDRDNQSGTEFIVTLFDHTELYNQDDESLGFVALAVHELRTPLTMLRGYIEVFEEELEGKADEQLQAYLRKLRLSSDQLASFVSTILNVIKVEENQLTLYLVEKEWGSTLQKSAENMLVRAQVLGKTITFDIAKDLPTVAIDPVSISEVVNNLLDNAIKYSPDSTQITVTAALNQDGMIETTVQDFGVGVPESVLPNLFEKFYRNHRTRNNIGGTGLGLFLTRAIIRAHSGNIWVKSKVGEGSSFTFTLQPYSAIADELKSSNNGEIVRQAHGWIKNHSMYRR